MFWILKVGRPWLGGVLRRRVMRRSPPCLWWWAISTPEAIRDGVRRFKRCDKALAVVQVAGAVTQISFNRSVAVPVHSFFDWTSVRRAGKRGSAWEEESLRSRTTCDVPGTKPWCGVAIASDNAVAGI